ncbi:MAG: DUF5103 domain-containing protein, partial [Bacteroidales bacterium]|nr:DUF5103 domain-containing protein [Bacteroidales bacterium]
FLTALTACLAAGPNAGLNAQTGTPPELPTELQWPATIFKSVTVTAPEASTLFLPMLELGSGQKLQVGFDDVADRDLNLRYRLVLCNPDAKFSPASLNEIEYIDGQNALYIESSELSMATRVNYAHYTFDIPSAYQQLKKSGLYKAEIYAADRQDDVVLTVPFLVCEPLATVSAAVFPSKNVSERLRRQQLAVEVRLTQNDLRLISPDQSLKVYAVQNLNWRTARRLPLQYSTGNTYHYEDAPSLVFDALNEFRNFDIRARTYPGRGVERLELDADDVWHVFLYNQKSKLGDSYVQNDDLNGRFVIKLNHSDDSDIEADYAHVHFFLDYPFHPDQRLYVTGDFNNWRTDDDSRLYYDGRLGLYTTALLLKQGFYDYMILLENGNGLHYTPTENDFQETENDYYILVFYREPGGRHDRLIGVQHLNSRE